MKQLISFFKQLSPDLSEEDLDYFLRYWTIRKEIKQKEYLLKEGETEKNLYFILRGTCRIYHRSHREECEVLAYSNSCCNEYLSFTTQKPSKYYVQALKDTLVIGISRTNFYKCILSNRNLERAWRIHTEQRLYYRVQRQLLLRLSAKQKIEKLLQLNPAIFEHFPKKYIASYLNMTP